VLSGRGLCDELIARPEESYRLWSVVVCDLETSWMRRSWPTGGLSRQKQTNKRLIRSLFRTLNKCKKCIKHSTVEWLRATFVKIIFMFSYKSPRSWANDWPKHVGNQNTIN